MTLRDDDSPFSAPEMPDGLGSPGGQDDVHERNRRIAEGVEDALVELSPEGVVVDVSRGWYEDGEREAEVDGEPRDLPAHLVIRCRAEELEVEEDDPAPYASDRLRVPEADMDRLTGSEVVKRAARYFSDAIPLLPSTEGGGAPPVGDREFRARDDAVPDPGRVEGGNPFGGHPDPPPAGNGGVGGGELPGEDAPDG